MTFNEFNRPFSKAEMDAMRRATRNEGGILSEAMALIRRIARRIPFAEDALALYYCARDPATDRRIKWVVLAALAYFVLPIDTIPDILPLLGYTDDAAVIAAAYAAVRHAVTDLHRQMAREALRDMA